MKWHKKEGPSAIETEGPFLKAQRHIIYYCHYLVAIKWTFHEERRLLKSVLY